MAIGAITTASDKRESLGRARDRAALIPELVVEAHRISNTVIAGWHGRRKRGIGEHFWQYRPHTEGETLARIDWRRSARGDETYVRDLEWEAAHTVWIWCDQSPSMLYRSNAARISKEQRAMVIAFSLAELLSRGGERVGYPGLLRPAMARNGAERLASALMSQSSGTMNDDGMPSLEMVQKYSDLVVVSDFLQPQDDVDALMEAIAARGARAHLIQVVDPAEETFPYSGRTEFVDPETGAKLTAGRAQEWAQDYRNLMAARRQSFAEKCGKRGWSFTVSHTDALASEALLGVYAHMSGQPITTRHNRTG